MAYLLTKVAVLSAGSILTVGGVVGISSLFKSGFKWERPYSTRYGCWVYEAKTPVSTSVGNNRVARRITEFTSNSWSKDEFLKKIDEKQLWNKETLKSEIEGGCSKYGKAFVWWGRANNTNGETWIYASDLNTGRDWLKENGYASH
ncbi:hypothetical protein MHC_04235 [Mycoplasma haemocanis str. Illinois]|uniref:Uncharacterized protein n=1 Tax=Mycoplasma haemocanis (strain Illinois) TaxID=1111676 RepID=H6N7T1_MYCHN|nr:hypothetical protein [Mycoplasma haemocanis]AEW45703.1 hypothetical protein MHC_04235 [Mycoplasma haemocanis str. Illinois]